MTELELPLMTALRTLSAESRTQRRQHAEEQQRHSEDVEALRQRFEQQAVGDGRRVAVGRHELLRTVTGDKRVREEDRGDHSCAGGQAHEVDSGRGSGGEPDA